MQHNEGKVIYFILNAGGEFGLGHLIRCKTLGEELSYHDYKCIYIIDNIYDKNFKEFITNNNHILIEKSINEINFIIKSYGKPLLTILDKKYISQKEVNFLKTFSRILLINDNKREIKSDYILNTNIFEEEIKYKKVIKENVIQGSDYNLIDDYYFELRNIYNSKSNKILITMGGEDPSNSTLYILKLLRKLNSINEKLIVIGPSHPKPNEIYEECKKYHKNYQIYSSPNTLKPYFSQVKICFSASGLTLLDLVAANIPTIAIPLEFHQEALYLNCLKNNLISDISKLEKLEGNNKIEINDFFPLAKRNKLRKSCDTFIKRSGISAIVKWIFANIFNEK